MSIRKKGSCSSSVIVSSSVYVCESCGHTEIVKKNRTSCIKKCPKCDSMMNIVSSHAEESSNIDN